MLHCGSAIHTAFKLGGASTHDTVLQGYFLGDTKTDDLKHASLGLSVLKRPLNENPPCETLRCAAKPSGCTASFHTVRPLNTVALSCTF